jgi:uncharacterized membrane protein (DUF485 family)
VHVSENIPDGVPPNEYQVIENSAEFQELRRKHRSFVFPLTIFFLLWYFAFVIAGAYFHEFMAIKVLGNINVGMVFGLLQFVTTFVITALYVKFANNTMDPMTENLRTKFAANHDESEAGR